MEISFLHISDKSLKLRGTRYLTRTPFIVLNAEMFTHVKCPDVAQRNNVRATLITFTEPLATLHIKQVKTIRFPRRLGISIFSNNNDTLALLQYGSAVKVGSAQLLLVPHVAQSCGNYSNYLRWTSCPALITVPNQSNESQESLG